MTTDVSTSPPGEPGAKPVKLKRRRRWARLCLLLLLLLAALTLAVMRSPATGWIVGREVARALGCEASIGSAQIKFDGRVVIRDLVLRVPELDGPAGEFLRVRRVEVDMDWTQVLILSSPVVQGVRMHEPLARVSVTKDGSGVSLAGLKPARGGGGSSRPPRIDAFAATLEFGEHGPGGSYEVLKSLPVTGSLTPLSATEPKFAVKLQEIQGLSSSDRGLLLEGDLDLGAGPVLELRLHNVDLARWGADTVPTAMRDVWSTLGMRGKVPLATLRFDGTGGSAGRGGDFRVGLELADVAMNALIPSDVPSRPGAAERPLTLTTVNGTILFETKGLTARLRGEVEDMPAQVVLTTDGIGLDAPVRCELIIEKFEVSKDPDLMPFAPPIVRENFLRFSGPTAVVDARVVVTRGASAGGKPGEITTQGSIAFENGAAAFDKFPYPVEQLRGLVRFDDKAIELVNIRGRGLSGAIVSADGKISPPRKGAEMIVNVLVLDAPIDEYLLGAMTADKRDVLEKLFNRTAAAELSRRGLTATAVEHDDAVEAVERLRLERAAAERAGGDDSAVAELVGRLAASEGEHAAIAARPVFDLGGKVAMDIRVFSPLDRNEWDWGVDVRFGHAGVLPSVFPLPMVLSDGLLRLNDREASLVSGSFTGIVGGTARVEAMVKFDGPHAEPDVRISAEAVPVDDLLLHAIAYDQDLGHAPATPKEHSAAALLDRLALEGAVDCIALVHPGPTPDAAPVYDVTVEVDGLRARPADAAADGVRLEDVSGRLHVAPGRFDVPGLSATMVSGGGSWTGNGGTPIGRLSIVLNQASGEAGGFDAEVTAQDLDIAQPFESLVEVASAKAAERVGELRAEHRPEGVIDATVQYRERPGADANVSLVVNHPRNLAVDALGGRVALSDVEGTVAATIDGPATSATFDGVKAGVSFDGEPPVTVQINGETDVGPRRDEGPERVLSISLGDARFESSLTRSLVATFGGEDGGQAIAEARPTGPFTALATVTSTPAGRGVRARIEPEALTARVRGRELHIAEMSGGVTIERDAGAPEGAARGRIDRVHGRVGATDVDADGEWALGEGGAAEAVVRFDASAPSLDEGTFALLPEKLRSALSDRKLRVDGPIAARDARVLWQRARTGAEPNVAFAGAIDFERASLDGGVDIAGATGTVNVDFNEDASGTARWTVGAEVPILTAEGVALENAFAELDGGGGAGGRSVRLRSLSADCHGGRLVAQAMTRPAADENSPATYDATVTLSGARFASVVADLRRTGREGVGGAQGEAVPVGATDTGAAAGHAADESRGWIDASISISGEAGRPATRLGGGSVRVSGGDVIRLPLVLPLLEMSNLALPAQSSLDYADASFRIAGQQVELQRAAILSDAIGLVGYGVVDLPRRELDLKFNTLAATRIPLWTDVWETVRNEIVGTAVRGTIDDPTFEPESLGGTFRFLSNVFAPRGAENEFDPVRVDNAARAERARLKRASQQPATLQPAAPARGHRRTGRTVRDAGSELP